MLASLIERIRRNHALEHATLHMLEEQTPRLRAGGRAASNGFYLYGDLPNHAAVTAAANQAIQRMGGGEHDLAVHPRCGTNVVTAGVLGGALAFLGVLASGKRAPWYAQLSNAMLGAMIGGLLAVRVGPWMQANVTTSPEVREMRVTGVRSGQFAGMPSHFVETR
jgi:hypothetical protein